MPLSSLPCSPPTNANRGRALGGAVVYGVLQFGATYALAYYALVELHAGFGQILPVDAHPAPGIKPDGKYLLSARWQTWDATFGVDSHSVTLTQLANGNKTLRRTYTAAPVSSAGAVGVTMTCSAVTSQLDGAATGATTGITWVSSAPRGCATNSRPRPSASAGTCG